MPTISTYKQHSFIYSNSNDLILLRGNCDYNSDNASLKPHPNYESNASTILYAYNTIKAIGIVYIIHEKDSVEKFLLQNNDLASLLLEAQVQIECRFGDVPLFLELHTDYENPGWTKLFLTIKSNLPNDEASEMLENLYKKWFFKQQKSLRKLLTITEE